MTADNSRRLRDLCAHVHDDDGVEAWREDGRHQSSGRPAHKDAQMAKAAVRAVEQEVCGSQLGIDWAARVMDVQVSAGAHLRVWVGVACPRQQVEQARQWLAARAPAVRTTLARTVSRKRVPTVGLVMEWLEEDSHGR